MKWFSAGRSGIKKSVFFGLAFGYEPPPRFIPCVLVFFGVWAVTIGPHIIGER